MHVLQTGIRIFLYILALWIKNNHIFLNSADFSGLEVFVCQFITLSQGHDELLKIKALFIEWLFNLAFMLFNPLSLLRGLILVTQHGADQLQLRIHLLALFKGRIHLLMVMQS